MIKLANKRNLSRVGTILLCLLFSGISFQIVAQVPPRSEARQEQREEKAPHAIREALERLREHCNGCTLLAEVRIAGEENKRVASLDLKGGISIEEGFTPADVLIIVLDAFNRATRESYERCANEREEIFTLLDRCLKQREEQKPRGQLRFQLGF